MDVYSQLEQVRQRSQVPESSFGRILDMCGQVLGVKFKETAHLNKNWKRKEQQPKFFLTFLYTFIYADVHMHTQMHPLTYK